MILGASEGDVPTFTEAVRTSCVVPAMSVVTCRSVHWPTRVTFDGFGAKQEILFCPSTAEAKAPEDNN